MPWLVAPSRRLARCGSGVAGVLAALAMTVGCFPTSSPDTTSPVLAEITALLATRAEAARAGDRAAWDSTLASTGLAIAGLRDEFEVFSALPWQVLRYERPRVDGTLAVAGRDSAPTLDVNVTVVTQLRGVESAEHRAQETFTVTETPAGWRLAGHPTPADLARPWLAPGTKVALGRDSVVIGTADRATLDRYAADADSAVAKVVAHWSGLEVPMPMVVVPATTEEVDAFTRAAARFGATTGGDAGTQRTGREVAAFTDGPTGTNGRATGDRIILDPARMERLTPAGRAFVVTHETVHVALRSRFAGRAPLWLQEGFADHVGYDGSGLAPAVIAADALEQVRTHGAPTSLPTTDTFGEATGSLQVAYQLSWLLVDGLVADHGAAKVQALIEAATVDGSPEDSEAAADRAMVSVLGVSRQQVLSAWQDRLVALAGASRG